MIPPILMYHRIGQQKEDKNTVSPERFELQLQYLEDHGYETLSLGEWYQKIQLREKLSTKSVILTFDDGYRDNWELAMPLLKRYQCKATVFMVADLVGQTNQWEKNEFRQGAEMMTAEHLKEWVAAGFEVGSHGMKHQRISGLNEKELKIEVEDSKRILESITGKKIDFFCYPHGSFDTEAISALQEAGYLGAVAIYEGASWDESRINWFALPRIRISDQDEPGFFRWKVSRYHSWLGKTRRWEHSFRKWIGRKK